MAVENLTKQFLQSIEIIADKKLSTLNFNKTIEAKIISIDNLDKGEYSVIYQNNIFKINICLMVIKNMLKYLREHYRFIEYLQYIAKILIK